MQPYDLQVFLFLHNYKKHKGLVTLTFVGYVKLNIQNIISRDGTLLDVQAYKEVF